MLKLKNQSISVSAMSALNISCIVMSFMVLGCFHIFRSSFDMFYSLQDLGSLFALSVIIIVLPSFYQRCFSNRYWYSSESFSYFLLIILLIGTEYLVSFLGLEIGFLIVLYTIAIAALVFEFLFFIKVKKRLEYILLPLGLAIMALVVYGNGTQSLFLYEKLSSGGAHQDPVFHIALSNIFKTTGIPSLGLDGELPVKYHWFSHCFFSVLSSLTNTSSLLFYNVGVLAVLGPLFFKSFYYLANEVSVYRNKWSVDIFFFITILFVTQSFMGIEFWSSFLPFTSESYGLSLVLMAFYLSTLLVFLKSNRQKSYLFYLYTFLAILIILFTKVSTGMILIAGLSILVALNYNLINTIKAFLVVVLLAVIVAFYIIELNRTFVTVSPFTRVARVIKSSDGLILYASGLILFLYYWYKSKFSISIKGFLKSLNSLYGFLFVMAFTGLILAFYLAYNTSDPFYFGSVQFLFSFVVLVSLLFNSWINWGIGNGFKKWALVILFIMSIGAHFDTYVKIQIDKQDVLTQLPDKDVNAQLLVRILLKLNETEKKESMVLYLDDDIKSLISARNIYSSTFAPSALSGIPSVGGISSELGSLKGLNYGLNDYYKSDYRFINSIDQAILRAEQIGKKELIHLFLDHEKQVTFEIITL